MDKALLVGTSNFCKTAGPRVESFLNIKAVIVFGYQQRMVTQLFAMATDNLQAETPCSARFHLHGRPHGPLCTYSQSLAETGSASSRDFTHRCRLVRPGTHWQAYYTLSGTSYCLMGRFAEARWLYLEIGRGIIVRLGRSKAQGSVGTRINQTTHEYGLYVEYYV